MKDAAPQTIYLKDYQVAVFLIDKTNLVFDLGDDQTSVVAELSVLRNLDSQDQSKHLVLDGSPGLDLQWVKINGQQLDSTGYLRESDSLTIFDVPDTCVITTEVIIKPQLNTTMMGLYRSRTMYCTQCEAEGFRDITYYLDRPDVMSEFTTKVIANREQYPCLLYTSPSPRDLSTSRMPSSA